MQDFLIQLTTNHSFLLTYATVTLLGGLEGPIISMVGGALLRLGFFSFFPFYMAVMIGDLIGDVIWYHIGRSNGRRFIGKYGKYFNINEEQVEKVEQIFHHYKLPILFVSKITNGFGLALVTLMTAGMVRIPFWRFIGINMVGQLFWSGILIATGFFFSHLYMQINSILGRISLIAAFAVLIYGFIRYRRYLQSRIK